MLPPYGSHCIEHYLRIVATVELGVEWLDVLLQKVQPFLLEADLLHVHVISRHVLVAARDTRVLHATTQRDVTKDSTSEQHTSELATLLSPYHERAAVTY